MKKTLLMTGALLALSAGLAFAGPGGLNLSWLDCGVAGLENRTFACNTNTGGGHILVASFKASSFMVSVTGQSAVLDAQGAGVAYPAWWTMRVGGCRASASLAFSSDFTGGPFNCYDYWQAGCVGGSSMDAPVGNRARIKAQCALPAGDSRITAIPEGTEVYAFKLTINNLKTAGLGACAGCLDRVCICFNSLLVTQTPGNPAGNKFITAPAENNIARWQGTANAQECEGATPAKNATWGQVKSLYR
jgi:hypothetical protein